MNVEGGGAPGRQPLLDERIELARQQMKRHIAAAIGVDQDEIVSLGRSIEEYPAVARLKAHALAVAKAEIGLGRAYHARIDLDRRDGRLRQEAGEIGRDRSSTQAEH